MPGISDGYFLEISRLGHKYGNWAMHLTHVPTIYSFFIVAVLGDQKATLVPANFKSTLRKLLIV
jgi:hypothetical protein